MLAIQIISWPYRYIFPRLVILYAMSKAFKAMAEQDKDDLDK